MIYPFPEVFTDIVLLLLRWMIAAIFLSSGWSHFTQPAERGGSLGMSPAATRLLVVEAVGPLSMSFFVDNTIRAPERFYPPNASSSARTSSSSGWSEGVADARILL